MDLRALAVKFLVSCLTAICLYPQVGLGAAALWPEPTELALRLDREYNTRIEYVGERERSDLLTSREQRIVNVHVVEIPLRNLTRVSQVKYVDSATGIQVFSDLLEDSFLNKNFLRREGNQWVLKVYYQNRAEAQAAAAEYGGRLMPRAFSGARLLSHSTHHVIDPETQNESQVKFPRSDMGSDSVERSVLASRLLRTLNAGTQSIRDGYMMEPGAAILPDGHHFSLRNPEEPSARWNELTSLHSLLGFNRNRTATTGQIERYAAAAGMTKEDWVRRELLPRVGSFVADAMFEHGALLEAHTQNILVKVNANGRIERLVYRDFRDVVFDPMLLATKRGLNSNTLREFAPVFRPFPIEQSAYRNETRYAGIQIATYANQVPDAAWSFLDGKVDTQALNADLALGFLNRAESLLRRKLPSSDILREYIRRPQDPELSRQVSRDPIIGLAEERGSPLRTKGTIAHLVQRVYDEYLVERTRQADRSRSRATRSPTELATEFIEAMRGERVVFTLRDSQTILSRLASRGATAPHYRVKHPAVAGLYYRPSATHLTVEFRESGGSIIAYTKETNHVLGATVPSEGQISFRSSRPATSTPQAVRSCRAVFGG